MILWSILAKLFPILWMVQGFPSPGPGTIGSHGLSCSPNCIAFDAFSKSGQFNGTGTSWTHVTTASANAIMLVWTADNQADHVLTVTYNTTQSLTKIKSIVALVPFTNLWCLVAPNSGSHSIAVTQTSDNASTAFALTLYNANQSCTLDNSATYRVAAIGGPATLTQSITPNSTNTIVADADIITANIAETQTALAQSTTTAAGFSGGVASSNAIGTAVSTNSSWSIGNTNQVQAGIIVSVATH